MLARGAFPPKVFFILAHVVFALILAVSSLILDLASGGCLAFQGGIVSTSRFYVAAVLVFAPVLVTASETLRPDFASLKKEVAELRQRLKQTNKVTEEVPIDSVDTALANKYGPNAAVTSRQGKLRIGGLVQVWFYSIQNDRVGWTDADQLAGGPGSRFGSVEVSDNDSFRIRRAQLRFDMDIHENVRAHITIDPAQAACSHPTFGSNLGNNFSGTGSISTQSGFCGCGSLGTIPTVDTPRDEIVRGGLGNAERLLRDAWINYHGVVPHHDFTVGQFRRRLGEEGWRDDGLLDFAERAMITQLVVERDIGIQMHGTWLDDRVQYWVGAFNGSGTAFQQRANRSDTNDEKDIVASVQVRPVWKNETWGDLELGYSYMGGWGGEAGGHWQGAFPVDGLDRRRTWHSMQYAWASYHPGGPVRGWWIRGEWGRYTDRFARNEISTGLAAISITSDPAPMTLQGWFVSSGYKLGDGVWAEDLPSWARKFEVALRYEVMDNLLYHDLDNLPRELDIFKTQIFTAGVNYYFAGHKAKLQLNYNWVVEEDRVDNDIRQVREVRNDNLILSLQVAF